MVVVGPERDLVGRRGDAARHERHVQTGGDLDGLQVVGAVVGPERALLERVVEAEELLGVVAQLGGDERAEVDVWIAGEGARSGAGHDQAGDENRFTGERCAH